MRWMSGRRRFTRYVQFVPSDGCARIVSDCVVEQWDGMLAVVVTSHPAEQGQEFVMQFTLPSGATRLYPVRVLSCALDPRHGPMRFRLHVEATSGATPSTDASNVPVRAPRGSDSR